MAALVCVVAPTLPTHAQDAITLAVELDAESAQALDRARALIESGEGEAAYASLAAREVALAGHPVFDYLLGVAALDAGRYSEAIFSLRRSLAVAPAFSGARMELARAYFEAGNTALARPLFERLLTESPPPGVDVVISQYLNTIERAPTRPQSGLSAYVEGAAGYDTNANGSTADQQFLGFVLNERNVEADSPFAELAAGLNWLRPADGNLTWVARVRGSHRSNPDASFVDSTFVGGLGGVAWQRGWAYGNVAVEAYWAALDGDSNEAYSGLSLLVGSRLTENWDFVANLSAGAVRFDDSIEVLDVDRVLGGLGVERRIGSTGMLRLQAVAGDDAERVPGSPYGNSKLGVQAAFRFPLGGRASLSGLVGTLETDYDGRFFNVERSDTQRLIAVEIAWPDVIIPGLTLAPALRWIDNASDVPLYTYDRVEVGLRVRWSPR